MSETNHGGVNRRDAPEEKREVLRELFETWHTRIYQTCFRLMGHPQEAEDITQDVFVRAFQAYGRFRGDADPGTWLYRIAVNQCLNVRRRKRRLQWLARDFWNEGVDETTTGRDRSGGVEEDMQQADRERIIGEAIDALPERQRAALILAHFERMSYKAIAETMDCTPSAVESLLHRAKSNLGKSLRSFMDDL